MQLAFISKFSFITLNYHYTEYRQAFMATVCITSLLHTTRITTLKKTNVESFAIVTVCCVTYMITNAYMKYIKRRRIPGAFGVDTCI